jgi:DNA-binding NarL/FixJ family response regulator
MPTRILIADDNTLVRAALRQVLETTEPCAVIEARDGEEAIAKAKESKPDLIILDLAMPLMDGLRTARELGKILPDIPILMHTLYWSPRIQVEALKAGVRKAVPKSESGVLIAAVRELLGAAPPSAGRVEPVPLQVMSPEVTRPTHSSTNGCETNAKGDREAPAEQGGDACNE